MSNAAFTPGILSALILGNRLESWLIEFKFFLDTQFLKKIL